jgi:hypothetical protein
MIEEEELVLRCCPLKLNSFPPEKVLLTTRVHLRECAIMAVNASDPRLFISSSSSLLKLLDL